MKFDCDSSHCLKTVWFVAAAATILIYSRTLTITPTVWQDEVMLLDWGRLVSGAADQSYSINWLPTLSRPQASISYLGNGLQELFYNLFGQGPVGPRVSSILGALAGSFFLLGWLLRKRCVGWISLVCALLFLWDPLFVEGYRGARVDSWAMAFVLACCWLLATAKDSSGYRQKSLLFAAGASLALSGFLWVSAVILVPLVAYEFLSDFGNKSEERMRSFLCQATWLAVGAAFAALILLLLMPGKFDVVLHDLRADSAGKTRWDFHGLLEPFTRSPFVPLLGILALFLGRKWGLVAAFFAAVLGVLATGAYVHRDIYLLPYLLLAIACFGSLKWRGTNLVPAKLAVVGAFCIMLIWSGGLSLGARTIVAERQREARDPDALLRLMREAVGEGPRSVYLNSYELYYAGRDLGWRYFKAWPHEEWDDPNLIALVGKMDVLIHRPDQARSPSAALMSSLGFSRKEVSTGAQKPTRSSSRLQANTFTEYVVYEKTAAD